jgi:tetratricopeptide (TPR) repeat protein
MISAFVSLGEMLIKNGNTQEGYLYLQKAKDRDPIIGTTIYKRGLLLYSKGKTKDAIKSFKNASMLDNEDAKQWLKNNLIN